MTTMHHFGFIGFGLIGGSVAHALREQYPDSELMAYNYYITKPHPRLELAAMDGILDKITTDLADLLTVTVFFYAHLSSKISPIWISCFPIFPKTVC